jgi:hypothetical protein
MLKEYRPPGQQQARADLVTGPLRTRKRLGEVWVVFANGTAGGLG